MLVFLSHSGSDTDAATALKARIAASPAAREAGLEIWLDVDELRPGDEWQPALEAALERADAFIVYVGAKGVVNWVDRELRHALTRATGPGAIPFVPVLASDALDPSILPPFVRQFQAVTDPLGEDRALSALISALISGAGRHVALTDRPFVGLAAMGEGEADRFFGRDAEIAKLSDLVKHHPLIAVVADSGAGKSSLVRAGLLPAFRGGALLAGTELTSPVPRHVVVMRPGADPVQGLRDGVDRAARMLGLGAETRRALRQSVHADDPGETWYALACDIDHDAPDILLVIDQFEELLTAAPPDAAAAFVRLMLGLIDNAARKIRIVLTVRVDYVNLIRRHEDLFARLEADAGAAQFRLQRVSDAGLDEIVKRPLIMAGHRDAGERDALAAAIRRDMTGRPGDLALVQMALYATWRRAVDTGDDLMTAYAQAGGVLGALAHQAEETRQKLGTEERAALLPLFARLVRLGDTAGATRRIAALPDLGETRAALARKLATEEAGRLLMIGEGTVEIAHEALVAQWPWLQEQIQAGAGDIRTLARLGDRTAAWQANGPGALPNDVERAAFAGLAARHEDWLSDGERACLAAARRRATLRRMTGFAALVAVVGFGVGMALLAWRLSVAEQDLQRSFVEVLEAKQNADNAAQTADMEAKRATAALAEAARNAAGGLVALSIISATESRWDDAIRLALAAWPREADGFGVQLADPIVTLSRALPEMFEPKETGWPRNIVKAEFSPGGSHYAFQADRDAPFRLRRTDNDALVLSDQAYPFGNRLAFSPDGRYFSASTRSGSLQLVDLRSGQGTQVDLPARYVTSVAFSFDSKTLHAALENGMIVTYQITAPRRPTARMQVGEETTVWAMAASPDGTHLALGRRQGLLEIWNLDTKSMVVRTRLETGGFADIRYSADGSALVAFEEGRIQNAATVSYRILDARTLEPMAFDTGETLLDGRSSGDIASVTAMDLSRRVIHVPGRPGVIAFDPGRSATPSVGQDQAQIAGASGSLTDDHEPDGAGGPAAPHFAKPQMRLALSNWPILGDNRVVLTCVELSPDGQRMAAADRFGRLGIWSMQDGRLLAEHDLSFGPIVDMAFLTDTSLAVINASGQVRVVDLDARPHLGWWTPPERPVTLIGLAPDLSRLATRAQDTPVRIWDVPSGEPVATLPDVGSGALLVLSHGGTRLAALQDTKVELFDLTDAPQRPDPVVVEFPETPLVKFIDFSEDGRTLAVAGGWRGGGFVRAFDTANGNEVLSLNDGYTFQKERIVFSKDGKSLGVVAWHAPVRWFALDSSNAQLDSDERVNDDNQVRDFLANLASGHPGGDRGVLTPDKARLAVLDDGGVRIHDTATGTILATLRDRFGALVGVQFPEPGTLHAVTEDGRIATWNLDALAEGNAFDVACRQLADPSLDEALRGYPIVQTDPICGPDYAPPLPEWMGPSHAAIGYAP